MQQERALKALPLVADRARQLKSQIGVDLQTDVKQNAIEIRPYRPDDNAVLTELWHRTSTIAHGFLGAEKLLEHRKLVSEIYLPQAETWVACVNGEPVGFLGLLDDFVGGLFVSPDWQGNGIGQSLVKHGLDLKGSLRLDVYTANESAVRFYSVLGFEEVDRRAEDKEGLPFEEITMAFTR